MRRPGRFAVAAVSAFALTGCATMNVGSHLDRTADFAQYRSYAWGPADALPTGDPRLDNNPFFHDYLQGAVERHLAQKGLRQAGPDTADLLVHYHASVAQRIEVTGVDRRYGYCYEGCEANAYEFEEGTLVLDVVDTRTNKVVWRGWAQGSVEGTIDNQEWLERRIDEAVTRMMALFPRAVRGVAAAPRIVTPGVSRP